MKKLINKRIITINALIFILGILAGIIFLIMTGSLDKILIKTEIKDYLTLIEESSITFSNLLNSLKYNILYIIFITITGIIYIFSPIILFINFYKGMTVGFLLSSLILTFKLKGVLYGILMIFPHQILFSILIIVYSSIMLIFSYKLLKGTVKNENINLKLFIKKISILFITAILITIVISILEIYLNPLLIKIFI